jgi:hypothetical protein
MHLNKGHLKKKHNFVTKVNHYNLHLLLCENGEKSIMHQFGNVNMHNGLGITKRLLCANWSMGLNHFNLLLQCNGSMLFSLAGYQGASIVWKMYGPSLEAPFYGLFGLNVAIWSLTM